MQLGNIGRAKCVVILIPIPQLVRQVPYLPITFPRPLVSFVSGDKGLVGVACVCNYRFHSEWRRTFVRPGCWRRSGRCSITLSRARQRTGMCPARCLSDTEMAAVHTLGFYMVAQKTVSVCRAISLACLPVHTRGIHETSPDIYKVASCKTKCPHGFSQPADACMHIDH